MDSNHLISAYLQHHNKDFFSSSATRDAKKIQLKNLNGSSKSIFISNYLINNKGLHIFIFQDNDEAAYFYNDINKLLNNNIESYFYPSSYRLSAHSHKPLNENIVLRTEVLNSLNNFKKNGEKSLVIVTYPEAIAEKVVAKSKLKKNTLKLNKGENISRDFLREMLAEYRFENVDFVYEPGQYAVRGSIVDVFSYSYDTPFRIDFFGDEVESIRAFDIETQLSDAPRDNINIVPNLQNQEIEVSRELLLDYLPSSAVLWFNNKNYITSQVDVFFERTPEIAEDGMYAGLDRMNYLTTGKNLDEKSLAFKNIELSSTSHFKAEKTFNFNTSSQPQFNKNLEQLVADLSEKYKDGYQIYILTESEKQTERLNNIFQSLSAEVHFDFLPFVLHEGFIDQDLKICVYTDHQIFDRYHKYSLPNKFSRKEAISIKEFNELKPGDYVVHIDHGIGKFGGLEKVNINGKLQETIRLVYRDNDILYVSIHSLHKVSKYKGKEGAPPKIYKLGTGAWQKLKQGTKKKVKDIAKELIALYAQRKLEKGFAFSADSYLQNELEASFFFEDTPDQIKATKSVKEQMESAIPMDLLVCGDVGFGKTEVAIRAAFKAVTDSKQVAVLVPTTILAFQHYQTFRDRLKGFPCNIDYLSRHKSTRQQNEIIDQLKNGKLDIIIGTHRLASKDIEFKDLGLLIIDEEQKFGVGVKEKLRQLKQNIDTLTLTATPIPRTLQFSMMGARDLAIINTPPPNRYPVNTEVHVFNEMIIKEGIEYEVSRGGQVFFIHNRVQNIIEIELLIHKLCPKVKIVTAHGQMDGKHLENIMLDFISGDYDVLIATTIIESGLDIPNTNTIFINNAQNFGLSDLHQLRGRVGRSNKKAFCYLLTPPPLSLTNEARQRLKAIEEFSELGSGFNISLQDLDIRGAGNLLGGEQSGFIADIGFEAYHQILDEAIEELRETEFKDFYNEPKTIETEDAKQTEEKLYTRDCQIDTDMEILFPDAYISNISERIRLYRELDSIKTEEELSNFAKKLNDRFGEIPQPTMQLLNIVRLRWIAIKLGFELIILKNKKFVAYFISDQQSKYFQSGLFLHILRFVQNKPERFRMKEGIDKLSLIADNINSVDGAIFLLNKMYSGYESDN